MEVQHMEFSIEDILDMHRHWITKLYVEDGKTDVEIVGLLRERGFIVTLTQVRRCIGEWTLVQREVPTGLARLPEVSFEEDWEWIPSQRSPTPSHIPSDPGMVDLYSKRPLPSIPPTLSPDESITGDNETRKPPTTDRLKVTCHHGPDEAHEVETTLCHVPNGPTPLETYTEDEQSHEMLALGLERDRVPRPSYLRSGQLRENDGTRRRARKRHDILRRKRKS